MGKREIDGYEYKGEAGSGVVNQDWWELFSDYSVNHLNYFILITVLLWLI